MKNLLVSVLVLSSLCACQRRVRGITTTPERRVWVIEARGDKEHLFRCVDQGSEGEEPRPSCMAARLGSAVE